MASQKSFLVSPLISLCLFLGSAALAALTPTEYDYAGVWSGGTWTEIDDEDKYDDPLWKNSNTTLLIDNSANPNLTKHVWFIAHYKTSADVPATLPELTIQAGIPGEDFDYCSFFGPEKEGNIVVWHWAIKPQPSQEAISFPDSSFHDLTNMNALSFYTLCVPVPGAFLLGGLGVSLVGWLKRRRTL